MVTEERIVRKYPLTDWVWRFFGIPVKQVRSGPEKAKFEENSSFKGKTGLVLFFPF